MEKHLIFYYILFIFCAAICNKNAASVNVKEKILCNFKKFLHVR